MNSKSLNSGVFISAIIEEYKYREHVGEKPGAEHWTTCSDSRKRLFSSIRDRYCRFLGVDIYEFPYSEDGVILYWHRYRKIPGDKGNTNET
jgi:hypothetical protein